ncbi:MAG TPA: hypothetical protein PLQ01_09585 [Methanothrix sp.]|nr:hypothetical protein [Methanothrix sp.]
MTGGDDNRAQEKYRPAFSFRNKAKMLFSANMLPRSPDDTYAYYSRWILLEFLNVFDPRNGTGDPDLDSKLQTPEELSGLLNIALAGLKRLKDNGWRFSYDKTVEDVERMYKRNANPVYAFLLDECEPGEAIDCIEKTLFYNRFKTYALEHGIRPLSSTKFSELLKDQAEIPVSTFRPYIEHGDRPWCWQGVKFKDRANMCQSRLSRVLATPSFPAKEDSEEEIVKGKIGIRKTLDNLDCKAAHDISSELEAANARQVEREKHFNDVAAKITAEKAATEPEDNGAARPSEPAEKNSSTEDGPKDEIPRPVCYLAKVRGAAIIEYGYNGWVDPAKIAPKAGLLECQVCRALVHLGYEQFERHGGGIGFRQRAHPVKMVVAATA